MRRRAAGGGAVNAVRVRNGLLGWRRRRLRIFKQPKHFRDTTVGGWTALAGETLLSYDITDITTGGGVANRMGRGINPRSLYLAFWYYGSGTNTCPGMIRILQGRRRRPTAADFVSNPITPLDHMQVKTIRNRYTISNNYAEFTGQKVIVLVKMKIRFKNQIITYDSDTGTSCLRSIMLGIKMVHPITYMLYWRFNWDEANLYG